jgi:hypothetical protein
MKLSIGRLDKILASKRPAVEKLILLFSIVGQYTSQSQIRRDAEIDEEVLKWHDTVLNHALSFRCEIYEDYEPNYELSLDIAVRNCLLNGLCKR